MPTERKGRQIRQAKSHSSTALKSRGSIPADESYQRFPLFRNIHPQDIASIVADSEKKDFSHVQQVLTADKCCGHVVMLVSGFVKIVQGNSEDAATILRLSGPGELIDTLGLFKPNVSKCSAAIGLMPSEAFVWDGETFDALMEKYPVLARNTQVLLTRQLDMMEDRLRELSFEGTACRLSRQIIRIMNQVGYSSGRDVEIPISRKEIAQLIGADSSTVTRLLAEWTRQGILKRRREKLTIINLQALIELSQRGGISRRPDHRATGLPSCSKLMKS